MTARGQAGDVILVATLDDPTKCDRIVWEGATSPAVGGDKCTAKVNRSDPKKQEVTIKCDGAVLWEGIVWVVWSSISQSPAEFDFTKTEGLVQTGDGTIGPGIKIELNNHTFIAAINPSDIISDLDIPDLKGAGSDVPQKDDRHVINNEKLEGGADKRWDISRRIRIKILNPHLYPKGKLIKLAGDLYDNQPLAAQEYPVYPTNLVVGNDDTSTGDEDNDPYTLPFEWELVSEDYPSAAMRHSTGADGDTFEDRSHFGEFARLMLNTNTGPKTWYRISWFFDWRAHFVFKREGGKWHDDLFESNGAANNDGW